MLYNMNALSNLSFHPLDDANPNILLYRPKQTSKPRQRLGIILLATWMGGATASRIATYCKAYQKLFPATPILLIRTVMADMTIKSSYTIRKQLEPAADYIKSLYNDRQDTPPALLHIFSHGGCNMALQLSHVLRTTRNEAFPIPLRGIIIDSCPGYSTLMKSYSVATHSLPRQPVINLVGRIILVPMIATVPFFEWIGILSSVEHLRRELNDLDTFGTVPRLYLHSAGDAIVTPEGVVSHADELAAKGVSVRREQWERAAHCALPVEDKERYWKVIEEFVGEGRARDVKL